MKMHYILPKISLFTPQNTKKIRYILPKMTLHGSVFLCIFVSQKIPSGLQEQKPKEQDDYQSSETDDDTKHTIDFYGGDDPPLDDKNMVMMMDGIYQWINQMNDLAEQQQDEYSHTTFKVKNLFLLVLKSKYADDDKYEDQVNFINKVMDNMDSWKKNRKWTPIVK